MSHHVATTIKRLMIVCTMIFLASCEAGNDGRQSVCIVLVPPMPPTVIEPVQPTPPTEVEPVADTPYTIDMSLCPFSTVFVEYSREQVLLLGQSCMAGEGGEGSVVQVRLLQIAKDAKSCMLEIKDTSTGDKHSGWVNVHECAAFAKEEVGTSGLEVTDVLKDRVTIAFNWGGVEER
jgi:hypothetical protein